VKTLAIIALTVFTLALLALTTGDLQVHEDGSYTFNSDIPFSQAWRD
jgi:hypothetical protein